MVQYEDWIPAIGDPVISEELIIEAETRLGFKIPEDYIEILRQQNGGFLKRNRVRVERFSIRVDRLHGLGLEGGIDSDYFGEVLNQVLIQNWGYPESSLVICHQGHEGFAIVREKENSVVYCDSERYPPVMRLYPVADSVAEFIQKIRYG